MGGMVSISV